MKVDEDSDKTMIYPLTIAAHERLKPGITRYVIGVVMSWTGPSTCNYGVKLLLK